MLILGSSSKARYKLLVAVGLRPDKCLSPEIDETQRRFEMPSCYVKRMATEKANSLVSNKEDLLITADTVVVRNRNVFHKTSNREIARTYLKSLSGKRHVVFTAFSIKYENKISCHLVKTTLKMKYLSDKEIEQYLISKEWIGKAGAYSIQGQAISFFTFISGCYSNVIGLPIPKLTSVIKNKSVAVSK